MSYQSKFENFVFERYSFDAGNGEAIFEYSFDSKLSFKEKVTFKNINANYDAQALESAMQLSFYLVGISYYKCYPTKKAVFKVAPPDQFRADFLNKVYHEGLSQFMFENSLKLNDMINFVGESVEENIPNGYGGGGLSVLQSGGKDSLLLAELLLAQDHKFMPIYVSSSHGYPDVLNKLGLDINMVDRQIDIDNLRQAKENGALNGHVPVTYIICSYAIVNAVLQGKSHALTAIGNEGEEPHEYIDNMPVNHQWSKTWGAEQLMADYVGRYISPNIKVGSPLRGFSELKIAELFVQKCWAKYGHSFSSCNRANYAQGADNTHLKWCGDCPKCANSYLLFAPFVEPADLQSLFGGQDLFQKPSLLETFKGLLGIDGVMKPFECVGEVDELRLAYRMAQKRYPSAYRLPFQVPESHFDYMKVRESQPWVSDLIAI